MKNLLLATLKALNLPVKLLVGLFRKKPKRVKGELEQKQRKHVRNFDPARLKNRSWQKSIGKDKQKKEKKKKHKVSSQKKN